MYLKLITNTPYPQFDIYEEDRLVVRIKIDEEMQALRIMCKNNRRVFFIVEEKIRKTSVWNLVNEYSQPLGTMIKHKITANSGEVDIEGIKLNYQLMANPLNEIILFDNNNEQVLDCQLNNSLLFDYNKFIDYFIFALSWYTFLSKEKSEAIYFAEA